MNREIIFESNENFEVEYYPEFYLFAVSLLPTTVSGDFIEGLHEIANFCKKEQLDISKVALHVDTMDTGVPINTKKSNYMAISSALGALERKQALFDIYVNDENLFFSYIFHAVKKVFKDRANIEFETTFHQVLEKQRQKLNLDNQ